MKSLKILLVLAFASIQFVQAQTVKKQFKDEIYTQTTVVIKEDGANDLDILNDQFDLDDYDLGQVIKITTAPEQPPVVEEQQLQEATAQVVTQEIEEPEERAEPVKVQEVEQPQPVLAKQTVEEESEPVAVLASVQKKSTSRSSGSTRSYKSGKRTKVQFKVRKKKRRRSSRRSGSSCYSF